MKIKLVSGATAFEAAKNTIKKIDAKNLDILNLVVVPDSFSLQAESLVFDVLNIKSTINIEVVGISRLAGKIMRNENIAYQRVSGLEEIFNIFKATKSCEDKFKYFKDVNIDFCLKILQIIKQFKACQIRPQQIKEVGDELLDAKMHDLKCIYQVYEDLLGEKFDLSKMLEYFLEKAEGGLNLSKINLYFVNFDSFSKEINSFICRLSKCVNEVCIGYSKPLSLGNAFIYDDDIIKKTTQLAKENGVMVEVETVPTSLQDENLALVENLFSFDVKQGKSDKFLNVVAKNKQDEVEFVAKYIKHELFKGATLNDFAVAVADREYFEIVKNVFNQYDLTLYCDEETDLSNTILGRFVLKLLHTAKLGFSQEDFKYLAQCELYAVDNFEQILHDIDYFNIEDKEEFIERYPSFAEIVNDIENINKQNTISSFVDCVEKILLKTENEHEKILQKLNEKNLFKTESQNLQAVQLIEGVLQKLKDLGGQEKISLIDFESLFTLALKSVKVETIPTYIDAVYVGDATTSYFEDVSTLFVLGATANALPKAQSDTGIIDDDDIRKVKLDFALEPEIKVINRRNRLKLFEMLQHFKDKLIVSYPMMEGDKLSQRASFLNDLLLMFGNNIIHTASLEDVKVGIYNEEEKLEKLMFFVGNVNNLAVAYTKMKAEEKLPVNMLAVLKNLIVSNLERDNQIPNNSVGITEKCFGDKKTISASQLESYFSCPFKHFLTYGLKIQPNENIEPNRRLFGTFQHLLLETFVKENISNLDKMQDADIDAFLNANMNDLSEKVYDKKILKRDYFVKYLKNESKIILKNVIKEQKLSEFKPKYLEKKIYSKFAEGKDLIGFVDRIDIAGEHFRIIDYKTGKTDSIKKDLFYGKKLQLFLYANSIEKEMAIKCGGVYYFDCQTKYTKQNKTSNLFNGITLKENNVVEKTDKTLIDDDVKSSIIGVSRKRTAKDGEFAFKNGNFIENFEILFDYAVEISKNALKEIEDGNIERKPFKDGCKNCIYNSVCCYSQERGYRVMQSVKDI